MSDESFEKALDGWAAPPTRDLWPEIAARLDRADDPIRELVDEVRALRAEVAALRRAVLGRTLTTVPLRMPEPHWVGKERA